MKLSEIRSSDSQLDEVLPALAGAALGGLGKLASGALGAVGGDLAAGAASAVGGALADKAMGAAGLGPDQAAAASLERNEKKKEIQDAIQQKTQEINDLRKQLAELG